MLLYDLMTYCLVDPVSVWIKAGFWDHNGAECMSYTKLGNS